MRRWLIVTCAVLVVVSGGILIFGNGLSNADQPDFLAATPTSSATVKVASPTAKVSPTPKTSPGIDPGGLLSLKSVFVPQAPFGKWDDLHSDACEEASLLTVVYFRKGQTPDKQTMDTDITNLVHAGEAMGQQPSITLEQLSKLALGQYGLTSSRIEDVVTVSSLRKELAANRPVIIPAAGRELGNPNFTSPGPIYHMLVVVGHDPETNEFITQDPGTRMGELYRYPEDTLLAAIHDYDAGEEIDNGTPRYLVFD